MFRLYRYATPNDAIACTRSTEIILYSEISFRALRSSRRRTARTSIERKKRKEQIKCVLPNYETDIAGGFADARRSTPRKECCVPDKTPSRRRPTGSMGTSRTSTGIHGPHRAPASNFAIRGSSLFFYFLCRIRVFFFFRLLSISRACIADDLHRILAERNGDGIFAIFPLILNLFRGVLRL